MPDATDSPSPSPDGQPADARERARLCDLLLELGPDAPTLCEGWATLDLAAHLVVRETDPRAGLAILGGGRFAGLESRLMDGAKARGLDALVERLRGGPPLVPWRLPGLRRPLNLNEWFVHHEDVRRANGREPREDAALDAELWGLLRPFSRVMLGRVRGAAVTLVAPGHGTIGPRGRGPAAELTGGPQELVLYLFGRRNAARVELSGDPEAVRAVSSAKLGI
ncbi:MAG TPA: TIGR03085 family metal-binding protein [Acidimicrobiales bacterium]